MIKTFQTTSQTLTFRIGALLAVTLLPLGLISVHQNLLLLEEAKRELETSFLAQTSDAAAEEAALFRLSLGIVEALDALMPSLLENPDQCEDRLSRVLDASPALVYAGYTNAEGIVTCASSGIGTDVSEHPFVQAVKADEARRVGVVKNAPVSKDNAVVVAQPVFENGAYNGIISVSMRHRHFFGLHDLPSQQVDFDVLTFNSDGEILTGTEDVGILPQDRDLEYLANFGRMAFTEKSQNGQERVYAAVPIIEGTVYALGIRERDPSFPVFGFASSLLFPIAMWLSSLGVSFFAVQRMVIRPMRNLRARMLMFVRNRSILEPQEQPLRPIELVEMDETWERIATSVLRDEAELHDVIHEKTVLLKEVHHRVKNNLQLIASILNMKMRKAANDEARSALEDIQQRVMSIARVHQKLYETSAEERVRADELLNSIAEQFVSTVGQDGTELSQSYDPMILYPDQAVPLSLAASELLSNALKYVGPDDQGRHWIKICLRLEDDGKAIYSIENSVEEGGTEFHANRGSGLGQKLIAAFANQMEADISEKRGPYCHRVALSFKIASFQEQDD